MPSEKRIHLAIDRAYRKARRVRLNLDSDKWVLFSDHHRGNMDAADDFINCKLTYEHALHQYLNENYALALLGDVEELWENKISNPIKKYKDVILKEEKFIERSNYVRIWGNHDDFWREKHIFWHYFKEAYKQVRCHECVVMDCFRDGLFVGEIVLVHGHQGSWVNEKFATLSRFFVRYGWRSFQKITGIKLTSASKNLKLKSKTDHALYEWSARNRKILICGHTHQPVFMSGTHLDHLMNKLHQSKEEEERLVLQKEILNIQNGKTRIHAAGHRKPLYFNTGCCSYDDGDITGIEINSNKIELIKWCNVSKKKEVLNSISIDQLFDESEVQK